MANIKYRGFASYRHKSPHCLHPTKQQTTCTDETANGLLSEVRSLGRLTASNHIRAEPHKRPNFVQAPFGVVRVVLVYVLSADVHANYTKQ